MSNSETDADKIRECKERKTVRVDLATFAVYQGTNGPRKRIGTVLRYVENQANRNAYRWPLCLSPSDRASYGR